MKTDNASLINQLIARWFPKRPRQRYTATIDAKEMIMGKTSGLFKETQKDKPSPVSQFTYRELIGLLPWTRMKMRGIERSFTGWTNSMEPTLDYGDLILKTPYGTYKERKGVLRLGQIAIYSYGNMSIIHRYIGRTPEGLFVFKGDNNLRADPPVKEEQITYLHIGTIHTWDKVLAGQD